MTDHQYYSFRRISFWFFLLSFLIFTPFIVSYSLGYKLDLRARRLQKTGALTVTASPKDAVVLIDGIKVSDSTPFISRGLLPKRYTVTLKKENFYPYQIEADIRSAMVTDVDATLIPQMRHVEKFLLNFSVYKFFVIPQMFGKKIIALTDHGIYEMGEGLDNPQLIAPLNLEDTVVSTIIGLKENKSHLVFWSQNRIWLVLPSKAKEAAGNSPQLIFSSGEMIRDIFWGLKGKYVVVQDGLKVFALDIKNPAVSFPLFSLNSLLADIFYDSDTDTLYVKDRIPDSNAFSLFRIALMDVINEKSKN